MDTKTENMYLSKWKTSRVKIGSIIKTLAKIAIDAGKERKKVDSEIRICLPPEGGAGRKNICLLSNNEFSVNILTINLLLLKINYWGGGEESVLIKIAFFLQSHEFIYCLIMKYTTFSLLLYEK